MKFILNEDTRHILEERFILNESEILIEAPEDTLKKQVNLLTKNKDLFIRYFKTPKDKFLKIFKDYPQEVLKVWSSEDNYFEDTLIVTEESDFSDLLETLNDYYDFLVTPVLDKPLYEVIIKLHLVEKPAVLSSAVTFFKNKLETTVSTKDFQAAAAHYNKVQDQLKNLDKKINNLLQNIPEEFTEIFSSCDELVSLFTKDFMTTLDNIDLASFTGDKAINIGKHSQPLATIISLLDRLKTILNNIKSIDQVSNKNTLNDLMSLLQNLKQQITVFCNNKEDDETTSTENDSQEETDEDFEEESPDETKPSDSQAEEPHTTEESPTNEEEPTEEDTHEETTNTEMPNTTEENDSTDWDLLYKKCETSTDFDNFWYGDKKAEKESKLYKGYFEAEWGEHAELIDNIGTAFINGIDTFGFSPVLNPLIAFFKTNIKSLISVNANIKGSYIALHNLLANRTIEKESLKSPEKCDFKAADLIWNKKLYKLDSSEIEDLIELQQAVFDNPKIQNIDEEELQQTIWRNLSLEGGNLKDITKAPANNWGDKLISPFSTIKKRIALTLGEDTKLTKKASGKTIDKILAWNTDPNALLTYLIHKFRHSFIKVLDKINIKAGKKLYTKRYESDISFEKLLEWDRATDYEFTSQQVETLVTELAIRVGLIQKNTTGNN